MLDPPLDCTPIFPHTLTPIFRSCSFDNSTASQVVEVGQEMGLGVRVQLEQRCRDWEASRRGMRIHPTGMWPFDDMQHRKHFYAVDKTGKVRSYLCS